MRLRNSNPRDSVDLPDTLQTGPANIEPHRVIGVLDLFTGKVLAYKNPMSKI
ncbi:MAG: hypothetical protein K8S54_09340 [Spirochaetia bacterium]|nr:hypothetical protein [Spirochaetia bacterium]